MLKSNEWNIINLVNDEKEEENCYFYINGKKYKGKFEIKWN